MKIEEKRTELIEDKGDEDQDFWVQVFILPIYEKAMEEKIYRKKMGFQLFGWGRKNNGKEKLEKS